MVISVCSFPGAADATAAAQVDGHWPARSPREVSPTSPAQLVYSFVRDSGGGTPKTGAQILLGFEPGGSAYIYAVDTTEYPPSTLAYHGEWSYDGRTMKLRFANSDLSVNATFSLSLSASSLTLPFQLMSSKTGSSTWQRLAMTPSEAVFADYDAAIADTTLALSPADALARAYKYAEAWVGQSFDPPRAADMATRPHSAKAACPPTKKDVVTRVQELLDAITIGNDCGQSVEDLLQDFVGAAPQAPLSVGTLATDPRVNLNSAPPGNGISDPLSKSALIIAPFTYTGTSTNARVQFQHGNTVTLAVLNAIQAQLVTDGFAPDSIRMLVNGDATITNIYANFERLRDPGVVIFETHGGADGNLATASGVGCEKNPVPVAIPSVPQDLLSGIECVGMPDGPGLPDVTSSLAVPTSFWSRLRGHGVDLHRSLVFVTACDTDMTAAKGVTPRVAQRTPIAQRPGALARAVQAGAYFAWNDEVSTRIDNAVLKYLVAALSRPTHTSEETFYNMLRVAKTGQMIYKEDTLLSTAVVFPLVAGGNDLYDRLDAYGWNGSSMVSYWGHGWESGSPSLNAGQIWWLVFAARWSHDINLGVKSLISCEQFWDKGQLSALTSVFCNNANDGAVPKKSEVDYASYLLTGHPVPKDAVPRWTLDDATRKPL